MTRRVCGSRLIFAGLLLGLALVPVEAPGIPLPWAKKPRLDEQDAGPVQQKLDVKEHKGKLFPNALPFDFGPGPEGLANASAQGCNACHPHTHDGWAVSAHAAPVSQAMRDAALAMPACLGCHLPLTAQHEVLHQPDGGRLDRSVATPNPAFQATLAAEGVTCVTCHVRDGMVLTATEAAAARPAPHPLAYSKQLGTSEACAACHQLAWPGAQDPLYDTYGEWKRSGFAEAGITCQTCHLMPAAAEPGPPDHAMRADAARAVSVLLEVPTLRLVRGSTPVAGAVVLQNTGAGHAFPTGSPYRGVMVRVSLVAPDGNVILVRSDPLVRVISEQAPFDTVSDTRIPVGETRRFEVALGLPAEVPAGRWKLAVSLTRTVGANAMPAPLLTRSWEVVVE